MEDIPDYPCPICNKPMTDVDGLIECQNDLSGSHFYYIIGTDMGEFTQEKPYFNLLAYLNELENRSHPQ